MFDYENLEAIHMINASLNMDNQMLNYTLSLLSGEDIWIKLLTQKRYTVHIDGCDV